MNRYSFKLISQEEVIKSAQVVDDHYLIAMSEMFVGIWNLDTGERERILRTCLESIKQSHVCDVFENGSHYKL